MLPWQRAQIRAREGAGGQVLLGIFVLVETIPRLADASTGVVLAMSFVALIPLPLAVYLLRQGASPIARTR
jgi:hypothetical protein